MATAWAERVGARETPAAGAESRRDTAVAAGLVRSAAVVGGDFGSKVRVSTVASDLAIGTSTLVPAAVLWGCWKLCGGDGRGRASRSGKRCAGATDAERASVTVSCGGLAGGRCPEGCSPTTVLDMGSAAAGGLWFATMDWSGEIASAPVIAPLAAAPLAAAAIAVSNADGVHPGSTFRAPGTAAGGRWNGSVEGTAVW